ncbi:outer membrane beta-barrel protein [Solimonas sp. SE-A11]|uniref:outer membrane beta-barrel protein n=1 Tax=Solimonas sp. SE-A11 TaxID=3054954 RepID=UPI00259CD212|nr:outer membrane beta-barrel protein [Solimonas sp. SE-A11]MDM4772942.1 outer membrane beta-barrel protein [Solimonas sp. SE-A11]
MSKYVGLLTAAGLACLPMMSSAAAPTLTEVLGASGVTLDGYISGGYTYGFNDENPAGADLQFRQFDGNTDSFDLNQAAFTLAKLPAQGAGGMVNVIAGEDAKVLSAAYGDGIQNINVTQAFLQYATGGLTVMGGRFVTLAGAEVINDTQNANISRGLLFTNVQTLVHTGVRASYKMGGATLYGGLSNAGFGGLSFVPVPPGPAIPLGPDADTQKTVELGFSLAPSAKSSFSLVGYHSSDNAFPVEETLIDAVFSLQATDTLQLVLNADYRVSKPDAAGIDDQKVWGLAAYGNMKLGDKTRGSLRVEYVDISDSFVLGTDTNAQSYTLTLGHKLADNLEILGELRYDMADDDVFVDGASIEDNQGNVAIKAIYKF